MARVYSPKFDLPITTEIKSVQFNYETNKRHFVLIDGTIYTASFDEIYGTNAFYANNAVAIHKEGSYENTGFLDCTSEQFEQIVALFTLGRMREYVVEINGAFHGTIMSDSSEHAARSYLFNAGLDSCKMLVTIEGENYTLYGGVYLSSGILHFTVLNADFTRKTLNDYYRIILPRVIPPMDVEQTTILIKSPTIETFGKDLGRFMALINPNLSHKQQAALTRAFFETFDTDVTFEAIESSDDLFLGVGAGYTQATADL